MSGPHLYWSGEIWASGFYEAPQEIPKANQGGEVLVQRSGGQFLEKTLDWVGRSLEEDHGVIAYPSRGRS